MCDCVNMISKNFTSLLMSIGILLVFFQGISADFEDGCGENEEFNSCGTSCQPTCSQHTEIICTDSCRQGCQCKDGFRRDDDSYQCVKCP
ncbi:hypothetical protein PV327_000311 [Microctonus hyperodae]|uniref:TIL domain-containing protein n=1 Tax=Microctonus hyperodae TaxID=165561 RepID=A0AA39G5X8_MICHY|nr:hypothetical protein PV327_000311 [Microctonus hyperodae]